MDVFFFIAGICATVLSILLAIALIYLIGLIRDVKYIVNKIKHEADNLSQDIESLRESVNKKGFQLMHIVNFFSTIFKRVKKGK
jgi:hypothetical protein